jgi:hypothetical protein
MADDYTRKLGPGTLTIGQTGTPIDVSCLINSATISASKNEEDSTTKLCGTVKPGAVSYDYSLAGNIDTDNATDSGLFALSQRAPGSQQPFTFTPNDQDADAVAGIFGPSATASGTLVLDPLDFGGDTMGALMTSDFEFTLVGQPTYAYPDGGAGGASADVSTDTSAAYEEPVSA